MSASDKTSNATPAGGTVRIVPCHERGVYLTQCFNLTPGKWSTVYETPIHDPATLAAPQIADALTALVLLLTNPCPPENGEPDLEMRELVRDILTVARVSLSYAAGGQITPESVTVQ
jgi:hypothetical protein